MASLGLTRSSPSESWPSAAVRRAGPELEGKVRAHIAALMDKGVSDEEASLSAVREYGCAEYGPGESGEEET